MKVSQKEIYNYLISKGLSRNHALGMLANIKAESNFNSGAYVADDAGTGKPSGGLFQHHKERFNAMVEFAGEDWKNNWKGQIDYALTESDTTNYINKSFDNPQDASKWFTINWERPKNAKQKAKERLSFFGEYDVTQEVEFKDLEGKEITIKGESYLVNPRGQIDGKDVIIKREDFDSQVIGGNQFARDKNYKQLSFPVEREGYTKEDFANDVNKGTHSYDRASEYNTTIAKKIDEADPEKIKETILESENEHEKYGYEKNIWDQFNTEQRQAIRDQANAFKSKDPLPGEKTEEEISQEAAESETQETQELLQETQPLASGVYTDAEGNLWRKGTEGGWQVKYNKATREKGAPTVNEFGTPSFEMKYDYQDDWTTLDKEDPLISNVQAFENQLNPFKGDINALPKTTTTQEPKTKAGKLAGAGSALLQGAGAALDAIGGPGAIISYIMGKKGLKAAMKEVQPQAKAELSPMFMQHLRQTRELAKKGFHPDQARKFRKDLDKSYQIGLENAVRGSGGQRAKFLAQSGVLDAQRSSALLDYAVKDEELQSKNQDKYEKMMLFKENFDIQRTEAERAEDMERQIADKKAAAGFTSAAFTNLLSGFGRSSLVPNPAPGTTNLYNTLTNFGATE